MITIKDVAKKCNVSVSTVSRAINNHPEISPKTKIKILEEIKKIGYIPNSNARNLKISTNNTIAVIIKGISNPFFTPMIKRLESEIGKRGYTFLLHKSEDDENELDVALKLVNDEKLKGIIFLGGVIVHDEKDLEKLGVPFVMTTIVNKKIYIKNAVYIGVDDLRESEKITNYLLSLGHKNILILGARSDDVSISMLRIQGYRNALEKKGLKENELVITTDKYDDPYTYKYGYDMAGRILEQNLKFTAVYCISDTMAIGFMKKMYENNLVAPRDYSIVGFDGLELNEYITPSITTIKQPVDDISKRACDELFNMIDLKKYEKVITFEGQLKIGQTTRNIN